LGTYWIQEKEFQAPKWERGLYLAATPIGNLGDITLRVLEALATADLIACEDTRVTGKLLARFGITTRTMACHEHNERQVCEDIAQKVRRGGVVVYASDAGMPSISDPGQVLVSHFREVGLPVTVLPGASAPAMAVTLSGMDASDGWLFAGFLPSKTVARKKTLDAHVQHRSLLVFFESPNRLAASLKDMAGVLGSDRQAVVVRELTKLHEEVLSGTLEQLAAIFGQRKVKGEIVLVVAGDKGDLAVDMDSLLRSLLKTHSVSRAASEAAQLTGKSKRDLYRAALKIGSEG